MKEHNLLIMLHCEQHTGYAIGVLEKVFFDAAVLAGYKAEQIFWSFSEVADTDSGRIIPCRYNDASNYPMVKDFIAQHNIKQVLAFDLGYPAKVITMLRDAGIVQLISYWGASMSSINQGIKLLLKRIEWSLRQNKPNLFIFESEAMRQTAIYGRGVPAHNTAVVTLGVDTEVFFPNYGQYFYAHESLGIPVDRKIIFYSGHMEERKGVRVIVQAAKLLARENPALPIHFVICGNKPGEERPYLELLRDDPAQNNVTFAGYRTDIAQLMRSSYIGVIASTGWDSFTMSSVEMMASGLPMIVSRLQGLTETIDADRNGHFIEPGDNKALAEFIVSFVENAAKSEAYSRESRNKAVNIFSRRLQVEKISQFL